MVYGVGAAWFTRHRSSACASVTPWVRVKVKVRVRVRVRISVRIRVKVRVRTRVRVRRRGLHGAEDIGEI